MPVAVLLCEGAAGSPDVRVQKKLLAGHCGEIRPMGSKYGMGERIVSRREAVPDSKVAGLLDGDFLPKWEGVKHRPRPWSTGDGKIRFGWRWERKEIENYIIDPVVVAGALGADAPSAPEYAAQLEAAANRISVYTAARTALSSCRRRLQNLPGNWGTRRGRENYRFPTDCSLAACRQGVTETVQAHGTAQVATVEEVITCFEMLLPEFEFGGARRRDFLWTFSGKDLLLALDEEFLRAAGFPNAGAFRERVLLGIEGSDTDVVLWVNEWGVLREEVSGF